MMSTKTISRMDIPTLVTWSRILAVPLILFLLSLRTETTHFAAALLFSVAAMTDWLDGYIARKLNAVSTLGQFLDPIADKILVTCTLIVMVSHQMVDPTLVCIFVARDFLVGGVRSLAASQGLIISAGRVGKFKAALQMIFIPLVILDQFLGFNWKVVGYVGLWGTVGLSVWSGIDYYLSYLRSLEPKHKKSV